MTVAMRSTELLNVVEGSRTGLRAEESSLVTTPVPSRGRGATTSPPPLAPAR